MILHFEIEEPNINYYSKWKKINTERNLLCALSPCIMSMQDMGGVQYTGGCSVHWGMSLSTLGCSVDQGES